MVSENDIGLCRSEIHIIPECMGWHGILVGEPQDFSPEKTTVCPVGNKISYQGKQS